MLKIRKSMESWDDLLEEVLNFPVVHRLWLLRKISEDATSHLSSELDRLRCMNNELLVPVDGVNYGEDQ